MKKSSTIFVSRGQGLEELINYVEFLEFILKFDFMHFSGDELFYMEQRARSLRYLLSGVSEFDGVHVPTQLIAFRKPL